MSTTAFHWEQVWNFPHLERKYMLISCLFLPALSAFVFPFEQELWAARFLRKHFSCFSTFRTKDIHISCLLLPVHSSWDRYSLSSKNYELHTIYRKHFWCFPTSRTKNMISRATGKSCQLDPIPTPIVLKLLDVLLPVITKLINLSFDTGRFAEAWKEALVLPSLKKPGLDFAFKNFRPVSNLSYFKIVGEGWCWAVSGASDCQQFTFSASICI